MKENLTWRQAWKRSKGPTNRNEALKLFFKGFSMGTADIIPGVSGGTVAFITGIYDKLLAALAAFDRRFVQMLLRLRLRELLVHLHSKFLVCLALGILTAIFSTARLMHYLLTHFSVATWSLFFGLIGGSILVVGRQIPNRWRPRNIIASFLGALVAYVIIGLIPVETPTELWFIFLCGMISITAMILPGISGSFLLLILGKYAYVTAAVKNPLSWHHFSILLVFTAGTVTGLLSFSKLLNYFFKQYRVVTMAVMTGFMLGSMRKIWPWKEILESRIIRGKTYILREANIFPSHWDGQTAAALGLMIFGLLVVLLIDRYASIKRVHHT